MTKTAETIEILAAWHAEQAARYHTEARLGRKAERKERAAQLAAHHDEAGKFLRNLVSSLREIAA